MLTAALEQQALEEGAKISTILQRVRGVRPNT